MPKLESSAFWGIAGIVVGIVVATFFFLLQKKKTVLQYAISTTPLITERMSGILNGRIFIDGLPVNSLLSTTITFFNAGNQRITSSDFAVQDPLRINLSGNLYEYVVSVGNQKLLPNIEHQNENVYNISFENLKPRQFFKVTILHDKTLEVSGELTTGTMQEYHHSEGPVTFFAVTAFAFVATISDLLFNGPVFTLILYILIFVLLIVLIVNTIIERKRRNAFYR